LRLYFVQDVRAKAVENHRHSDFNTFLRESVKAAFSSGRHKSFWGMIVNDGVTLISSEDDPTSAVTPEAARAFISEEEIPIAAAPVAAAAVAEEDDLFGNMM
jgi:hypothetical protein